MRYGSELDDAVRAALADPDALVLGGLTGRDLLQLVDLAGRDIRSLPEDNELSMLGGLALWGLYMDDRGHLPEFCGAGICHCGDRCKNERDDLSDDQRDWLRSIRAAWREEKYRRLEVREALYSRPADSFTYVMQNDRPVHTAGRARPREHRARRTRRRVLVRSGSRGDPPDGDDGEPADAVLEPGLVAGPSGVEVAT